MLQWYIRKKQFIYHSLVIFDYHIKLSSVIFCRTRLTIEYYNSHWPLEFLSIAMNEYALVRIWNRKKIINYDTHYSVMQYMNEQIHFWKWLLTSQRHLRRWSTMASSPEPEKLINYFWTVCQCYTISFHRLNNLSAHSQRECYCHLCSICIIPGYPRYKIWGGAPWHAHLHQYHT